MRTSAREGTEGLTVIRPGRDAALEVAVMSLGLLFTICFVLFAVKNAAGWSFAQVWRQLVAAGEVTFEHIGWGFGVYIPTFLGFYAIVVGKQWLSSEADAAKARRALGFVAEVLGATLIPPVVLVVVTCVAHPIRLGALLIVLPATVLMVFLSVQLGTFVALGPEHRCAQLRVTVQWTEKRLQELEDSSTQQKWVVVVINTGAAGFLGGIVMFILRFSYSDFSYETLPKLFLGNLIISVILISIAGYGIYMVGEARDSPSKWLARVISVSMFIYFVAAMMLAFLSRVHAVASVLGLLAIAIMVIVSSTIRYKYLSEWSIRGVARAFALSSVSKSHTESKNKLLKLTSQIEPAQDGSV